MFLGIDPLQAKIMERLLVAFAAGVIIGFDRERSGKAAGIRTQMLVCVASALLSGISIYLGPWYGITPADPARLMAQVVVGVGFLGAGVILKDRGKIMGMTTAATIWATAAIGISIGAGFYLPAILSVFLVLLLNPLAAFQYKYGLKGDHYYLKVPQKDEKKLEIVLSNLGTDVRSRSVKSNRVIATIISSQQRNTLLRAELSKAKISYDLGLAEE